MGFEVVASSPPDFELLVYRFGSSSLPIRFKPEMAARASDYPDGLTILRSAQCPYSEKNVKEIMETATLTFGLITHLIDLNDSDAVQQSPSAFGTFCILYNGTVISHHPNQQYPGLLPIMNNLLPHR